MWREEVLDLLQFFLSALRDTLVSSVAVEGDDTYGTAEVVPLFTLLLLQPVVIIITISLHLHGR